MTAFKISEIDGVIAAQVTPFDEDGKVDLGRTRTITRFLMERGLQGLYLTGSTGEGFMMSPDERKAVVETVVEEVNGALPIIVHVGAISTFHSVDLAKHAASVGADAISSVPPIYWSFSPDQVYGYYADITVSTDLPMIAYNVPLAAMGFDLIARLATIEGVEGVKYTATTHADILRIKEEIGADFRVYSGADEMAMSGLAFGADGIIGSFYNVMPEVFLKLYAAMKSGDLAEAKALQETANAVIFHALKNNPMSAMKRMMAWQGADAGLCRKPFDNFDAAGEAALKESFRKLRDVRGLSGVNFLDTL